MKALLFILASIIVLAVVVLAVSAWRYRGSRLETEIAIQAPPERVFPWLVEPQKLIRWIDGLTDIESLDDGSLKVGARSLETLREGKRTYVMETEVTALETNRLLGVRLVMREGPGLEVDAVYTLAPEGEATRLSLVQSARYRGWWMKALAPLIDPAARKKMEANFHRLKQRVETGGET